LPAFKMGGVWTSTKTRLRAHYNTAQYVPPSDDDESAEAPAAITAPPRRKPPSAKPDAPPPPRRVGRPRGSTIVRRPRSPRSEVRR
jgi:hypothetical protein